MAGLRITSIAGSGANSRAACGVVVGAVALCALVTGARAAHASPEVAVLGLEVVDRGDGLDQQTTQRAAWLTDELRAYAATDSSPYGLAPGSGKDLLEMKLLSGCADEALGCMAAIGRELGAERLLYGKLEKGKNGYEVSLTLLDTGAPAVESAAADRIPFTEASKSSMRAWARSLYNELTGVAAGGVLVVETNTRTGTVFVDGRPEASLKDGTARISDLEEGIHTVSIEADGYAPYAERVTVLPGEEESMVISLDGLDGSGGSRRGYRIGFGAALAATGLSAGAWGVSFYQLRYSLVEDKNAALEELSSRDTEGDYSADADVCVSAEIDRGSGNSAIADAAESLVRTCEKGQRRAVWTPIFGTAAVVGALAAGYFYYKGYGGDGRGAERDSSDESWSLQVSPRFGPDLVGAGLRLEF